MLLCGSLILLCCNFSAWNHIPCNVQHIFHEDYVIQSLNSGSFHHSLLKYWWYYTFVPFFLWCFITTAACIMSLIVLNSYMVLNMGTPSPLHDLQQTEQTSINHVVRRQLDLTRLWREHYLINSGPVLPSCPTCSYPRLPATTFSSLTTFTEEIFRFMTYIVI